MLLAESDPLQRLENIFRTLSLLKKRPRGKATTGGRGVDSLSGTPLRPGGQVSPLPTVPSTPLTSASTTGSLSGAVTPVSAARTPVKYTPGRLWLVFYFLNGAYCNHSGQVCVGRHCG